MEILKIARKNNNIWIHEYVPDLGWRWVKMQRTSQTYNDRQWNELEGKPVFYEET